ncbi:hypothetical protein Tco_0738347 [Tanacetum coccineum]
MGQLITGIDSLQDMIRGSFVNYTDDYAMASCCLGILQLVILGVESTRVVPDWMLRLANDRVAWDKYPWGSYVWPTLYSQLRNAIVKRWSPLYVDQPTDEDDAKKYSIFGYTWAFKTWILESYRVTAIMYFDRYNRYPRVAAWNKKKGSQNMYEIPSDIYREFDEQKREIERNKKEVDNMKEEMRKFREEMNVQPVRQENNEPIIADQHYGLSDFTQFQSTQVPFHMGRQNLQTTIETPCDGLMAFFTKVRRGTYINLLAFLNDPHQVYLDCYMKGYIVPVSFWHQLVPQICMPDMHRLPHDTPIGWLSGEHMNSWMELLIRRRAADAKWTVAYTSTISVHPENNRFIIPTDQYVIGTLDGTKSPRLVPFEDAIQERDTILMYTHHNSLHVYVSRVELSPLVVAELFRDETNKEIKGKTLLCKKLFD